MVFWDCLVDADLASNSAGWQWIAAVAQMPRLSSEFLILLPKAKSSTSRAATFVAMYQNLPVCLKNISTRLG